MTQDVCEILDYTDSWLIITVDLFSRKEGTIRREWGVARIKEYENLTIIEGKYRHCLEKTRCNVVANWFNRGDVKIARKLDTRAGKANNAVVPAKKRGGG